MSGDTSNTDALPPSQGNENAIRDPALRHRAPRCFSLASFTPFASLEVMSADIDQALRQRGVQVFNHMHYGDMNADLFKRQFVLAAQYPGRRFAMDVNVTNNFMSGDRPLYDVWALPRFTFLTDSPVHKITQFRTFPHMGLIGLVDLDFPEIAADLGLPVDRCVSFAHAGPPPAPAQPDTADRPIDVLIAGNVGPTPPLADWLQAESGGDPVKKAALDAALERCRTSDTGLWQILKEELTSRGGDISISSIVPLATALEGYLIAMRRKEMLENASRGVVHYSGYIDPAVTLTLPDNIVHHGPLPFLDILDLMTNTKIVVNSSPSFRNGPHERIFYGLSRGAFILTEPSRFMSEMVDGGYGVSFLPWDGTRINEFVADALDHDLDAVRQTALPYYAARHTWGERVDRLLAELDERFWKEIA
ncbi:hypothetical protein HH303_17765 [Rhodospirillaceae bacterium KN72]|uniref:Spore protein YkvP/CgeB glycosyl transferase-like domain-containing protein n=1 Tax=Pacificispira spongiicola TaxID=2729598 RepID=A0A7Y0HH47_9PROT|nr:hypothetical protein [Pacificispira spongiicola]NMM46343.1 hypothetical protein [Pacificispira spongiicola]